MFDSLSRRLQSALAVLRGRGRLSAELIDTALREVRIALLEADAALPVVRSFLDRVRQRVLEAELNAHLDPGAQALAIVREELLVLLGPAVELELRARPPVVVLSAGLQGAGKTTSCAKLAHWLVQRGHRTLLSSCDVYRPAAQHQLELLAEEAGADYYQGPPGLTPAQIAEQALQTALRRGSEVLIVDSAGRLHVDQEMMRELADLHRLLQPAETLFVVDAMMGQDALQAAREFHQAVPISGIILSKADGDARAGAALSVRAVTGAPIKFLGTGEGLAAFSPFQPERLAERILGMGDLDGLREQIQSATAPMVQSAPPRPPKAALGLEELAIQLRSMQSMGGISSLLEKLPAGLLPAAPLPTADSSHEVKRFLAIIDSMTPAERHSPALLNGSRKRRVAGGSGTCVQDVNRLLRMHRTGQQMMKRLRRGKRPPPGLRGF